jgi:thiol-disulfide isomerase/thioredoxin
MPSIHAASVLGVSGEDIAARPGRALVLIFLASWCEPCQEIVGDMRRLEQRYQGLAVDFFYVFAHDTRDDAGGFLREHGMTQGFLANHDVLQEFHNPELPSVYVGDRDGWLLTRYLKVTRKDLDDLNGLLLKITAF